MTTFTQSYQSVLPGLMQVRTLTTSKGRSVQTSLTNDEAIAICKTLKSSFAQELHRKSWTKGGLSKEQWTWVHILAVEANQPKPAPVQLEVLPGLVAMFVKAGDKLKYPKISLDVDGEDLQVSYAKAKGLLYISNGGEWNSPDRKYYGSVNMSGEFQPTKNCPGSVLTALKALSTDPVGYATKYGKTTGRCCFCSRRLTDEVSLAQGYGPVCATNYL